MKIHLMGTELFHADRQKEGGPNGRTGMTKLVVAFCFFTNAPKNDLHFKKTRRSLQTLSDSKCWYVYMIRKNTTGQMKWPAIVPFVRRKIMIVT